MWYVGKLIIHVSKTIDISSIRMKIQSDIQLWGSLIVVPTTMAGVQWRKEKIQTKLREGKKWIGGKKCIWWKKRMLLILFLCLTNQ